MAAGGQKYALPVEPDLVRLKVLACRHRRACMKLRGGSTWGYGRAAVPGGSKGEGGSRVNGKVQVLRKQAAGLACAAQTSSCESVPLSESLMGSSSLLSRLPPVAAAASAAAAAR